MKIAYLISGHIRTWNENISSPVDFIKFLEKKYNGVVDVFLSTHYDAGHFLFRNDYEFSQKDVTKDSVTKNVLEEIVNSSKILNIKKTIINFEEYKKVTDDIFGGVRTSNGSDIKQIYGMFYTLIQSIELKNYWENINKIKYDFVIRTRFDIAYTWFNDFDLFYNLKEFNCIRSCNFAGDQFFYMTGESVNKFNRILNYILYIIQDKERYFSYPTMINDHNAEEILTNFLKNEEIIVNKDLQIAHNLVRWK